jgi:recombination protein RecA
MSAKKASPTALARLAMEIMKVHGRGTLMTADRVAHVVIPRVSSGIFVLDRALGGGWPAGRISMVYGWESTGKTSLMIRAVAEAQRICGSCFRPAVLGKGKVETINPNTGEIEIKDSMIVKECSCGEPKSMRVAWVDQEGTWDGEWARRLGVYEERLILSRPLYSEQTVDVIDAIMELRAADIIVLDSIGAMATSKELEETAADAVAQPGYQARIMNHAIRKWTSQLVDKMRIAMKEGIEPAKVVPTLWLVNQFRLKIGVVFGNPEVVTGGRGQGFATSVEVRTKVVKYTTNDKGDETIKVQLGFTINKNKTAAAKQKGVYDLCMSPQGAYHLGDVMDQRATLEWALKVGLVKEVSKLKLGYAGNEYLGKKGLITYWAENPEEYRQVRETVLAQLVAS